MSATLIRFPHHRLAAVLVCAEQDGGGWLVLAPQHGWLHGSRDTALADASEIARGFGVAVLEVPS
jgi:hypothetical protein